MTAPAALLTLALAGLAYFVVPSVYQASSVVGLAPSPISGGEGNGIINNGGTIMLANLTAAGISSPGVAESIVASTGATAFDAAVVAVPGGQMPMLNLVASAHDREAAVAAVELSQVRAQVELNRIQANAGIPESAFGVIYQVSEAPNVEVLRPGRKKLVAGIVGLGLIISVLAGLGWDLTRSQRSRNDRTEGDARPADRAGESANPPDRRPTDDEGLLGTEPPEPRFHTDSPRGGVVPSSYGQ